MHEISMVESILEIAEAKAREQNAVSIQIIKLRIGEFTSIVPDALEFAFDVARQGTLAEHARLEIEIVPMLVRCVVCERESRLAQVRLVCTQCGFPLIILSGEELQIDYIEIED
jgi:hydrogenase nickel incorporation protein HypA/HybF